MLFFSLTAVFAVLLFADAVPTPTNNKGTYCSCIIFFSFDFGNLFLLVAFLCFLASFGGVATYCHSVYIAVLLFVVSYRSAGLAALYI